MTEKKDGSKSKAVRQIEAADRVYKLVGMYPDYSNLSFSYMQAMADAFEFFSDDIQETLLNPINGLASTFQKLPVVADVFTAGKAIAGMNAMANPSVAVYENTDAWKAWQAVKNTPCIDIRVEGKPKGRGWWFPSEYPPKPSS